MGGGGGRLAEIVNSLSLLLVAHKVVENERRAVWLLKQIQILSMLERGV